MGTFGEALKYKLNSNLTLPLDGLKQSDPNSNKVTQKSPIIGSLRHNNYYIYNRKLDMQKLVYTITIFLF